MDSWQRTDERPPLKRWLNTQSNWTAEVPRPEGPDAYQAIVLANLIHCTHNAFNEADRAEYATRLADKIRDLILDEREDVILEASHHYRDWNTDDDGIYLPADGDYSR